MFFKDDVDAGVALVVNTAVIEDFAVCFCWGSGVAGASPAVLPHQDQTHKHDLVCGFVDAGIPVRVGRISGKVAP